MAERIDRTNHSLVKDFVKLKTNKKYRHEQGLLILEGKKTITEVCAKFPAETLLVCNGEKIDQSIKYKRLIYVSREVIEKISTMKNPENIIAVVPFPQSKLNEDIKKILVLDGIADPGNAGTLIRTALAFGWQAVVFLNNSVDPFNDKTVRSAKSSLYYTHIFSWTIDELLTFSQEKNIPLWVADLNGQPFDSIVKPQKMILVLGNEAHGPSQTLINQGHVLTIPINPIAESLNVAMAGSILLQRFGCK
ncbi:MAG: RNA methyltransferase [Parachlamydiales bacterium]|nr:RNA methyltransferase [Parachlamydiales bacterium]